MATPRPRPPKDRFSSLDTLALARELRALDHPRVDKAFDAGPDRWVLALKLRSGERREVVLAPGLYGAVVEGVAHSETPGPFARELRRWFSGTILGGVADPGGDRVLDAEFSRADGLDSVRLIVEFFGTGNVLVVHEGALVAVAHPKTWAHRTLRVGAPFVPAPASPDPWKASPGQLEVTLLGSDSDRVSTLAARAGFSGPVAEELLVRARIPFDRPAREEAGSVAAAVHAAAVTLLAEIGASPTGFLYSEGEVRVDVTPYASQRRRSGPGTSERTLPTFGAAVLEYFASRPSPSTVVAPPADPLAGLRRQRGRQQEAVERLAAEAELKTAQANRIFERYQEAEAARVGASEEREPGEPVRVRLGDLEVPLDPDRPLEASARSLYEEAKKAKTKLAGAREALSDTERQIGAAPRAPAPTTEAPKEAVAPAGKPLWFEKFRWFLSSEGILVIAGRDAASNDLVVRRYLRAGDRYVHADLHGAASVVVKVSGTPGAAEPGEPTLREAGQFAVALSKAWRAGHASADAFWVLPEQVSKTGASGEFVARGAWVIHGTKHLLRDLPLELALGSVEVEGRTRWSVAPAAALAARGTVRAYLSPDDERGRIDRERELSREFGVERDLLQRLLPPGGLRVRRA